ncbi:MAG: helical backbone metal receptor [Bdellovibrionaceae bacterium]|nr:helical backbone metal receptor [Pseudobdellovibrionaceae bacterium]
MPQKQAKVISLVPSWTETLLECGVNVIARTRFCIHPAEKVKSLPVVGGTKSLQIAEIVQLKPDYVILDQEENKKEMADELQKHGIEMIVSHVKSVLSAAEFLNSLGEKLENETLQDLAIRYWRIIEKKDRLSADLFFQNTLLRQTVPVEKNKLSYVIWKNPYMVIGSDTFIADVFSLFKMRLNAPEGKYPKIGEAELKKYFCLLGCGVSL